MNSAPASSQQPASPDDDGRLLVRLRANDPSAYEDLVRVAGPRLLAVARRMLQREEDAHDAVQEAFLNAFKSLDRFDGRAQLSTWLHRITINACLMKRRSQRRRAERSIEELLPTFQEDGHHRSPVRPWTSEMSTRLEKQELGALIRARIDELPSDYSEIIILRDLEQLDTEQTAILLNLSVAAVKTRLHRARQALRTLLEQDFADGEP